MVDILMESMIMQAAKDTGNIDRDRYVFFNELSAYNTLIAEGLFQEFSNSFLLIASERGTN